MENRMKKTGKILGVAFLLTGLILVSIPLYYEWQHGREERALEEALFLLSDYEQVVASSFTVEELNAVEVEAPSFTIEELNAVLELEIPSIELKQKVLSETTEENLKIALTQLKENQHPGEGNFAIAGHRGYRGNRHFSRLPDVTVGDEVLLHTKNETFVYKVTDISIIEPTDVDVLDDREGKNEITMITCTRSGKQRVSVRGELVKR